MSHQTVNIGINDFWVNNTDLNNLNNSHTSPALIIQVRILGEENNPLVDSGACYRYNIPR